MVSIWVLYFTHHTTAVRRPGVNKKKSPCTHLFQGHSEDLLSRDQFITSTSKDALQWTPKALALANIYFRKPDPARPAAKKRGSAIQKAADDSTSELKSEQPKGRAKPAKQVTKLKETCKKSRLCKTKPLLLYYPYSLVFDDLIQCSNTMK